MNDKKRFCSLYFTGSTQCQWIRHGGNCARKFGCMDEVELTAKEYITMYNLMAIRTQNEKIIELLQKTK